MILFRKEQERTAAERFGLEPVEENRFIDVDKDGELGISLDARLNLGKESDIYKTALAQKEIAQRAIDEEIALQDRDNRSGL